LSATNLPIDSMRRSYVRKKRINTAAVVLAAVAAMGGTIWGMGALAHDSFSEWR